MRRTGTSLSGNASSIQSDRSRIGFIAGMLDGLVFLSYLFEIDQTVYYSITIFVKLILLFARGSGLSPASRSSFTFLYALAIVEIISNVANDVEILSSIRIFVFCINLVVTLCFVGTSYWRGLVLISTVDAAVYLILLQTGRISEVFGRYTFFANSHPNLGSEIFFGAAFACLFSKTPRLSIPLVALFFTPTFLMQGRAAELGILCVACILSWNLSVKLTQLGRLALFIGIAVVSATIAFNIDVSGVADKVLLLDSEYRGGTTNASGRGLYWASAFAAWSSSPLFGAGSDYFTRLGMLQPHNFFLYPLACYGLMGFVVLFIFLKKLVDLIFFGRLVYILPFIPMLAFNDRFVNLNTYPTVMFLFIFHELAKIIRSRRSKDPSPLSGRSAAISKSKL